MKVLVTGASGFLGSALAPALRADGDDVVRLVRRPASAADEIRWDGRSLGPAVLSDVDAVVHLAGAGVGDKRWTAAYKETILRSRVDSTTAVATALAQAADDRPRALLSMSAIGYYGDTRDRAVDESAAPGDGFLADVVKAWEAATAPATEAGVRVVRMRTGIVLGSAGGALGKQLLIFKLGLGGRLGSGRQWVSWVSQPDHARAVRFLLDSDVSGVVNVTAPNPVTNAEFTRSLGDVLHRPAVLWVPPIALKVALGGFATEALTSARVLPRALESAGFSFRHARLEPALQEVLAKPA